MSQINKTYDTLKQEFLFEMDFIDSLCRKLFIFPFIGRSKFSIYCYYSICGLIFLTSMQLVVTLCMTGFTDWFAVVNIAPNIGVCLMILVKYQKIDNYKELYESISQHYRNNLWEAVSDSKEHKNILNRYTQTTKNIFRFMYYHTIILAIIVGLFPRIIMFYETDIQGKEKQYLYPFDGWYPLDKIRWYNVVYIWESFMSTIVIVLYGFSDMLHIAITRNICMELKIIGNMTEGLISAEDVANIQRKHDVEKTHSNMRTKLKFILSRHQFLVKITSSLDTVLGDGMLLTYLFGSVFICLTVFTATVVEDLYMRLRYFSFFCSLLIDSFFQCIMGQLLIDHSEKLEKAIYSADWVYADSDTKNMLLIFLMRAQTPLKFTAKGYLAMNLDTFSGICSLSYQFFNLLRTSYSD